LMPNTCLHDQAEGIGCCCGAKTGNHHLADLCPESVLPAVKVMILATMVRARPANTTLRISA